MGEEQRDKKLVSLDGELGSRAREFEELKEGLDQLPIGTRELFYKYAMINPHTGAFEDTRFKMHMENMDDILERHGLDYMSLIRLSVDTSDYEGKQKELERHWMLGIVSKSMGEKLRDYDYVYHQGKVDEGEFIVTLPGNNESQGILVAERVIDNIEREDNLSVKAGLSYGEVPLDGGYLVYAADEAVKRAKDSNRKLVLANC